MKKKYIIPDLAVIPMQTDGLLRSGSDHNAANNTEDPIGEGTGPGNKSGDDYIDFDAKRNYGTWEIDF